MTDSKGYCPAFQPFRSNGSHETLRGRFARLSVCTHPEQSHGNTEMRQRVDLDGS